MIFFLKSLYLCEYTSLTLTFYWSTCVVLGKWTVVYMCVRDIKCDFFYNISIEFWNCSDNMIFPWFSFDCRSWKNMYDDAPLTSPNIWVKIEMIKKLWLRPVIKTVKMKYNRFHFKWWRFSTSFKIHF